VGFQVKVYLREKASKSSPLGLMVGGGRILLSKMVRTVLDNGEGVKEQRRKLLRAEGDTFKVPCSLITGRQQ